MGDVGPNHYVEMINLVFAVYSKTGTRLLGPLDLGSLWAGFPIEDCTDESGDPIVVYDQTTDRWLLTQFTTRGLNPATPTAPFYNCVAVSKTGDPTGAYHRYAFITQPDTEDGGFFFPDYPKYGVWRDSYIMTTRDFGFDDEYGISVYGLEKNRMIAGDPKARAVQFFLDSDEVPINLIGDGLLPPDLDGNTKPKNAVPAPIVGTQDNGGPYGATFDALNVWEFDVKWRSRPTASIVLKTQLPVAEFDSIFPCGVVPSTTPGVNADARDCLPQPGVTDGSRFLDILSYRQRPIWRLAYRNKGAFESMVTNQSVEALSGLGGDALVRDPAHRRHVQRPPAGHVRAARRRAQLDGQHRRGPERQHGARLQRRQRHRRLPGHPLHGPSRRRPAGPDDARRRVGDRGHRRADAHELAVGRLHLDERRPRRRLHVLVRQRVLHGRRSGAGTARQRLADPDRKLPAARLLTAVAAA